MPLVASPISVVEINHQATLEHEMSKLIKRLIVISAAFVPAFAAMQVQAATHHKATVRFVTGNGANHMVCGYVFFKGGYKVIALPAHAPVKEVYSFTNWVGTPFTTRFSDDCYAKATPYKNYLIQGNRTLTGF